MRHLVLFLFAMIAFTASAQCNDHTYDDGGCSGNSHYQSDCPSSTGCPDADVQEQPWAYNLTEMFIFENEEITDSQEFDGVITMFYENDEQRITITSGDETIYDGVVLETQRDNFEEGVESVIYSCATMVDGEEACFFVSAVYETQTSTEDPTMFVVQLFNLNEELIQMHGFR